MTINQMFIVGQKDKIKINSRYNLNKVIKITKVLKCTFVIFFYLPSRILLGLLNNSTSETSIFDNIEKNSL